jgi:hypothetical protein
MQFGEVRYKEYEDYASVLVCIGKGFRQFVNRKEVLDDYFVFLNIKVPLGVGIMEALSKCIFCTDMIRIEVHRGKVVTRGYGFHHKVEHRLFSTEAEMKAYISRVKIVSGVSVSYVTYGDDFFVGDWKHRERLQLAKPKKNGIYLFEETAYTRKFRNEGQLRGTDVLCRYMGRTRNKDGSFTHNWNCGKVVVLKNLGYENYVDGLKYMRNGIGILHIGVGIQLQNMYEFHSEEWDVTDLG